jgi:hypothetical protein
VAGSAYSSIDQSVSQSNELPRPCFAITAGVEEGRDGEVGWDGMGFCVCMWIFFFTTQEEKWGGGCACACVWLFWVWVGLLFKSSELSLSLPLAFFLFLSLALSIAIDENLWRSGRKLRMEGREKISAGLLALLASGNWASGLLLGFGIWDLEFDGRGKGKRGGSMFRTRAMIVSRILCLSVCVCVSVCLWMCVWGGGVVLFL